jgi:hypothetical protein
MQQSYLFRCTAVALCLAAIACNPDKKSAPPPSKSTGREPLAFVRNAAFTYDQITPAGFPKLDIPGFAFPQDSNTLNSWIQKGDTKSQYAHAWGIWTGITSMTDQKVGDEPLRVFETWLTPGEIVNAINTSDKNALVSGSKFRSNRANLKVPRQLDHPGISAIAAPAEPADFTDFESVAYSPAAAKFAYDNKIFSAIQLAQYQEKGNSIPPFPNDAITIKPVYKILNAASGKTTFSIPVWPPDPSSGYPDVIKGYPETTWKNSVQIDVTEKTRNPASGIFGLSDFIHYKLNKEDVAYFVKEATEGTQVDSSLIRAVQPGDIAILVAMHVTSREIDNWTWQTFWWAPDADNPPFPSSKEMADARPAQLTGAARHYAVSIAYFMANPNEPYAGNVDVIGKPNYGFNPYLEARFGSLSPGISQIYTAVDPKRSQISVTPTYIGIRSNCMSCHRMAAVNTTQLSLPTPNYVGNTYISQSNPLFNGMLLLDFAWSIEGNIDTTGFADYLNKRNKGK